MIQLNQLCSPETTNSFNLTSPPKNISAYRSEAHCASLCAGTHTATNNSLRKIGRSGGFSFINLNIIKRQFTISFNPHKSLPFANKSQINNNIKSNEAFKSKNEGYKYHELDETTDRNSNTSTFTDKNNNYLNNSSMQNGNRKNSNYPFGRSAKEISASTPFNRGSRDYINNTTIPEDNSSLALINLFEKPSLSDPHNSLYKNPLDIRTDCQHLLSLKSLYRSRSVYNYFIIQDQVYSGSPGSPGSGKYINLDAISLPPKKYNSIDDSLFNENRIDSQFAASQSNNFLKGHKDLTKQSNKAKAWKQMWINKFNKLTNIGKYEKDTTDKLLLSYLKERKLNIINKDTFNTFLAINKEVTYNFNKRNKYLGLIGNKRSLPLNTLYKLLKSFFKSLKSIISYPILNISPNKLIINLFYYVKPTRAKIKEHKIYHKYIRKDGKLFKDNLLRSKFSKVKHRFNFILFLKKWKIISTKIILPNIINKPFSLSMPLSYLILKLANKNTTIRLNKSQSFDYNAYNSDLKIRSEQIIKIRSLLLDCLEASNLTSEKNYLSKIFLKKTKNNNDKHLLLQMHLIYNVIRQVSPNIIKNFINLLDFYMPLSEVSNNPKALYFEDKDQLEADTDNLTYEKRRSEKVQVQVQNDLIIWLDSFLRLKAIISLFNQLKTYKFNLITQEKEFLDKANFSKIKETHILNEESSKEYIKIINPLLLNINRENEYLNNLKNKDGWDLEGIIELRLDKLETLLNLNNPIDKRSDSNKSQDTHNPNTASRLYFNKSSNQNLASLELKINSLWKINNNNTNTTRISFPKQISKKDLSNPENTFKTLTNKDKKEILRITREGLNELLILLKEQEYELVDNPLIINNSNPYANKNLILLIINNLHELYRASLRLSFSISMSILECVRCEAVNDSGLQTGSIYPLPNKNNNIKSGEISSLRFSFSKKKKKDSTILSLVKEKEEGAQNIYLSFNQFNLPTSLVRDNNKPIINKKSISIYQKDINSIDSPSSQIQINNKIKLGLKMLPRPPINSNLNHPVTSLSKHLLITLNKIQQPSIVSLNLNKFKFLIYFLEKLYNKPIELNLIRLKYPYHESNILAQVLALSSKRYKFFLIMRKLLYTASIKHPGKLAGINKDTFKTIPSYLSGIKVKLAGRLLTERIVPRQTVKTFQVGSLARGKVPFKTTSRITLKNKRGAYSFTVTTSHILSKSKPLKIID